MCVEEWTGLLKGCGIVWSWQAYTLLKRHTCLHCVKQILFKFPNFAQMSVLHQCVKCAYTPDQNDIRMGWLLSRYSVGTHQGSKLTCNWSGNAHSVISVHWATVYWSLPKERNQCMQSDVDLKKKMYIENDSLHLPLYFLYATTEWSPQSM